MMKHRSGWYAAPRGRLHYIDNDMTYSICGGLRWRRFLPRVAWSRRLELSVKICMHCQRMGLLRKGERQRCKPTSKAI